MKRGDAMKIVVLDGYTLNPGDLSWNELNELGNLTVYDRTEEHQILERIIEADYVYTNKTPLTQETLKKCKNLKWIGVLATGYNVVDVEAASKRGIPVCNVPSYGTNTVAQYVFALILELANHVGHHNDAVKEGRWTKSKDFCFWDIPLIELSDKTIGLIGYGRIGQAVANIAQAFGMKVLANNRHISTEEISDTFSYCSLERLYNEADFISLHCPLNDSTEGLINKGSLDLMKEGVFIINTSRGQLINEEAMVNALSNGKVAGYACDVVDVEPIEEKNLLLTAKNCVITPHIAWASNEARTRLLDTAVNNLKSFIKGETINQVNK